MPRISPSKLSTPGPGLIRARPPRLPRSRPYTLHGAAPPLRLRHLGAVEEELLGGLLFGAPLCGTGRDAPLEEHAALLQVDDIVAATDEAARDEALGDALPRVRLRLRKTESL